MSFPIKVPKARAADSVTHQPMTGISLFWVGFADNAISTSIGLLMRKVLFICSQNRLRSPTAENIFSTRTDIEVASAGLNNDAAVPVSVDLLIWADIIFVMEKVHQSRLSKKFQAYLKNKRIVCLDIPDQFTYMDPVLVQLLEIKVGRILGD